MKTARKFILAVLAITCLIPSSNLFAQEEAEETSSPVSVSADMVSGYVWRGTRFAGASFQPTIEFTTGGLALGTWGSYDYSGLFAEADLYAAYSFDFGLSLGVTDYYYPGSDYSEFGDTISSHALEINLGYEISDFYLSGNYILNNSANGAGAKGGDLYFEAGYSFGAFDLFVGGGDGWHTVAGTGTKDDGTAEDFWKDDKFGLCNIGISTSKEIKITDSFSLPVFGQAIWNPEAKDFNIVVGMSF
ncbi:MAG: hypothetical protein PF517_04090 [Salinivirgaceae bacterium]|jgi:hypothetical protein|nr:hypothetical protein [Salinivirgaceae bacterium]